MLHTMIATLAVLLVVIIQPITAQRGDRWPSFRGPSASGVGDGVRLPDRWSVKDGTNVRWSVGTPTVYPAQDGRPAELITNASNFIRGYDPDTGVERWRLGGSSKITAPTPVFTRDVIVVGSGRAPEGPLFAIKPGAAGDITLGPSQTSNTPGAVAQDPPRPLHAHPAHPRCHVLRATG